MLYLYCRKNGGRNGEITIIDCMGHLHGTWDGLAIIVGVDRFTLLPKVPPSRDSMPISRNLFFYSTANCTSLQVGMCLLDLNYKIQ